MEKLYKFIKEEVAAATASNATPGNTMGAGNPMPAGVNGNIGTEPLPTAKAKKQKRKKNHLKSHCLMMTMN